MAIQTVIQARKSVSARANANKAQQNKQNKQAEPVVGTYTVGSVLKCRCGKDFVQSKQGQILCTACFERAAEIAKADYIRKAFESSLRIMVAEGRKLPSLPPVREWDTSTRQLVTHPPVGWEVVAKEWQTVKIPARTVWRKNEDGTTTTVVTIPERMVMVPKGPCLVRGFGQSYTFHI